jgi:hypothetical protein
MFILAICYHKSPYVVPESWSSTDEAHITYSVLLTSNRNTVKWKARVMLLTKTFCALQWLSFAFKLASDWTDIQPTSHTVLSTYTRITEFKSGSVLSKVKPSYSNSALSFFYSTSAAQFSTTITIRVCSSIFKNKYQIETLSLECCLYNSFTQLLSYSKVNFANFLNGHITLNQYNYNSCFTFQFMPFS